MVPADTYARLLEAYARAHYDEPKAPCSAVQTAAGWIVATLVDGEVFNDTVRETEVTVETRQIRERRPAVELRYAPDTYCPECAGLLGTGAHWDEDRLGNDVLIGCSLCVEHAEREAAEARTDRAVDNAEQRAGGW
jgi:hypothetical protein